MAEPSGLQRTPRSGTSPLPRGAVLIGALGVGVTGDLLLRHSDGPGLNVFLLFVVLALAVGAVSRGAGLRPSRETLAWIAGGLLLALGLVLRASEALQLLAFLAAAAAFALPALRAGEAWARGSGVSDYAEAIAGAIVHSALGPLRLVVEGFERPAPHEADRAPEQPHSTFLRRVRGVLLGLLLAAPLLFVFGALFMSADRVFHEIVSDLLFVDLEELASRILLIGVLAWLASGYLSGFVRGTRLREWLPQPASRPSIGILEAGTALALLDALFAVFVLVQIRYLFGGSALVEATVGLTYAEYAREGFAQLVVAVGLVVPCLLALDWLLRRESPRDRHVFRALGALQLLLLLVVVASAVQRLRVYQEAFGLTEARFYGAVLLGWLVLLSLWFAATILSGRRDRFALPTVVSAFVVVAGLIVANPDARIAQVNLARGGEFDARYLSSLSADATPTLVRALPGLPPDARCTVARELVQRWGTEERMDWRSWNRSEARARNLVQQTFPDALPTPECPELDPAVPSRNEGRAG